MKKKSVSLSLVSAQPNYVELGPNQIMRLFLISMMAIVILIFLISCINSSWLLASAMLVVMTVLEVAIWRVARLKLVVSNGTVQFTDGKKVEMCNLQDITIQVFEHGTSEGEGNHYTAKMVFSNERLPDIFIQSRIHFFNNGGIEKKDASDMCAELTRAIGGENS